MAHDQMDVVLANPENRGVLAALECNRFKRAGSHSALEGLEGYPRPYSRSLYTHPDILDRMWKRLGERLPLESQGVCFGFPILFSPCSGLIFCVGAGTFYILRLDRDELAPESKVEIYREFLAKVGTGWKVGGFHREEAAFCETLYEEQQRVRP